MLYASFPSDFFVNQEEYSLSYQSQVEIQEEFNALDLTTYSSFANDTMNFGYTSIEDAPDPPQWETAVSNRYVEVWWGSESIEGVGGNFDAFEIRDTEQRDFLGIQYFVMLERADLIVDGEHFPYFFTRDNLEDYEDLYNLTIVAEADFIRASIILKANGTDTLGESWDNDILIYSLSWEIDFDAMKPSVWLLLGQLLTFQSPDFGIPGVFGEIITYALSLVIWAVIILISYTVITKLIPTIQGGLEN